MKTSLNELLVIEDFLLRDPGTGNNLLMQARVMLQPELKESIYLQQKTYELVDSYGRQKLRKEIFRIEQELFAAPEHLSFRQKIQQFFNK